MTLWLILVGVAGGIVGGMGMGGGTLLIPMLTLLCSVEQHSAQSCNLIAFIPMSIIAIIIHAKNGLIKGKYFWWTAIPATAASVAAAFISNKIGGAQLRVWFGVFLLLLGVYQLVSASSAAVKKRKNKDEKGDENEEKSI